MCFYLIFWTLGLFEPWEWCFCPWRNSLPKGCVGCSPCLWTKHRISCWLSFLKKHSLLRNYWAIFRLAGSSFSILSFEMPIIKPWRGIAFFYTFYFFWPHCGIVASPRPGIEPMPQLWSAPQLWQQNQIINPLRHRGAPGHGIFYNLKVFSYLTSDITSAQHFTADRADVGPSHNRGAQGTKLGRH